jgi:predicted negative regulator of RcsB-dependent stress response
MGILNFFSSKDPEDYEKKGDALFESGAYGKAIAEYERALERLEKSSPWDDGYRQSLRDKIGSCKEQLALEHENTATELMEAGHNDDARQYIELAQELTRDDQLKAKLEQHLKQLDTPDIEAIQATLPNFDNLDQEAEPEDETVAPEQDDEHFTALIGTLPGEIQETYRNYPAAFKTGYLALNQGDFEQAAEYLSQAMQEFDDPQSYIPLELATACLNLAKYEEASRQAEAFLQHHPDALPAYQLLCEIFWETKSFDRAETLLASLPEDLAESVAGYLLRGETLYHAEKYAEAKIFYRDFSKKYEWHEAIARALAKTHEALGERTNARYIYGEILDQCRSCHARVDPYLKQKFADLSFESGHKTSEVLELYLSLAQEIPQNAADCYQKISRIYTAQGNEVEAQRFQLISEKYDEKK